MKHMAITIVLGALLAAGPAGRAKGDGTAADERLVREILAQLGHDRYAKREAGFERARTLTPAQLELMLARLTASRDPELRFAAKRLSEIRDDLVYRRDAVVDTNAHHSKDGTVILLRCGRVYGAFMMNNQTSEPENATYAWVLMPRGVSVIDPSAKGAKSGEGIAGREQPRTPELPVVFGPFRIYWSGGGDGEGWVYYNYFPESRGDKTSRTVMCPTARTTFDTIDARSGKLAWKYNPRKEGRGAMGGAFGL